jgi:hypothetical protein
MFHGGIWRGLITVSAFAATMLVIIVNISPVIIIVVVVVVVDILRTSTVAAVRQVAKIHVNALHRSQTISISINKPVRDDTHKPNCIVFQGVLPSGCAMMTKIVIWLPWQPNNA